MAKYEVGDLVEFCRDSEEKIFIGEQGNTDLVSVFEGDKALVVEVHVESDPRCDGEEHVDLYVFRYSTRAVYFSANDSRFARIEPDA